MFVGLGLSVCGGQLNSYTPALLGSSLLAWHDPADLSVQWQDSARTTQAAVNASIGSSLDKSTVLGTKYLQQATGASRPILRVDGSGYSYWELDGLDDSLTSDAAVNLGAYGALTVCIGLRKETDISSQTVIELSVAANTNPGSFYLRAPTGGLSNLQSGLSGASAVSSATPANTAPDTAVISLLYDLAVPTNTIRRNSVQISTTAAATGGGAFGNYSYYVGRRAGSSLPFTGRVYQIVIAAGLLTGSDLTNLERFVGSRMGISL
jgi:hypothetical protein